MKNSTLYPRYMPGQEWLYIKIYSGQKTAEILLRQIYSCCIQRFVTERQVDLWFYTRFADPEPHIRLRFHLTCIEYFYPVLSRISELLKPFLQQLMIWKVQTDTYFREIDRYGENSISLVDEYFFHDSQMVCQWLVHSGNDAANQLRWKLSLLSVDAILNDFKLQLPEKQDFVEWCLGNFKKEFHLDCNFKKQLDKIFRKRQNEVEKLLDYSGHFLTDVERKHLYACVDERTVRVRQVVRELMAMDRSCSLEVPVNEIIADLIHMHCNRSFQSCQQWMEMILCAFLQQYYFSRIGRSKYRSVGSIITQPNS